MDFKALLAIAEKNANAKNKVNYYPTKFEAPKKLERKRSVSENVKRVLEKIEADAKPKTGQNRNETKNAAASSSSKFADDDYGFESQASSSYYKKFERTEKNKENVKNKSPKNGKIATEENKKNEKSSKKRPPSKATLSFDDIIKLASQKQSKPIVNKNKEEKLLTQKQKLELQKKEQIKAKQSSSGKSGSVKVKNGAQVKSGTAKEFPPKDLMPVKNASTSKDVKPIKQFPPLDVRGYKLKMKKQLPGNKRRILDDDSEEDSEMDDFIDKDEPQENYSKYITEIFGYDKSKYKNDEFDDRTMVSSYEQQMKEECISKKIAIKEDEEELRKEEERKKRKRR